MKRILVIITTSFVSYGGLATVALNYFRHIDKSRFLMDFASINTIDVSLENELKMNGSKYYQLPKRASNPVKYMHRLKIIANGYDVIHIHANSATAVLELFSSAVAGAPKRILHIHNSTCDHKKNI